MRTLTSAVFLAAASLSDVRNANASDITLKLPISVFNTSILGDIRLGGDLKLSVLEIKDRSLHASGLIKTSIEKSKFNSIVVKAINSHFLPYDIKDQGIQISKITDISISPEDNSIRIFVNFDTNSNLIGHHNFSFAIDKTLINGSSAEAILKLTPESTKLQVNGIFYALGMPFPGQLEYFWRKDHTKSIENFLTNMLQANLNRENNEKHIPSFVKFTKIDLTNKNPAYYNISIYADVICNQSDINSFIAMNTATKNDILEGKSLNKDDSRVANNPYDAIPLKK